LVLTYYQIYFTNILKCSCGKTKTKRQ